jgi:hypothetical protein
MAGGHQGGLNLVIWSSSYLVIDCLIDDQIND